MASVTGQAGESLVRMLIITL